MRSFFCFTISDDKVADCSSDDSVGCCTVTTYNPVHKFSWEEINKRTRNFSKQIASGGFSTVYLARLPGLPIAAVKLQSACTQRLARIHHQELQILTRITHPNIVKFLGHCDDGTEDQRVLVFEYASNGTLHDNLHTLTWKTRTLIAFQLAASLEYLHGMEIIHGDIKSANILLDQHLNCKLCDFGSARFTSSSMTSSSTKMIIGSQGYVDPYYLKTGLVTNKSDVYSYGVVLLELITGREAFSLESGEMLTEVITGNLEVAGDVVDPRLRCSDGFDLEEVMGMVSLARKCIAGSPTIRPCATEIVAIMRKNFRSVTHL